jgi:hypothetical protein
MIARIGFLVLFSLLALHAQIQSPDDYLNTRIGADKNLVAWPEIVKYMHHAAAQSPRVAIREIGKSTLGNEMLLMPVSSEKNIARLDDIQKMQAVIAGYQPAGETEIRAIREQLPAVVLITLNIHSTEIASSQESMELVYELATRDDEQTCNILDNVVILLVPSLNPDGQEMISDWYMDHQDTEYENAPYPYLYHHYAGHDNNRDWHYFNLAETRNVAKVLYQDWFPEVVYDQHQMGSSAPRMFLPPYADPVNPNVAPELMALVNRTGTKMVADLTGNGFTGIATGTIFNAYFQGTMSKTPLWHNMVGILSEMASCRIASPVFFGQGSLKGFGPDLPEYKTQNNFLQPWPGGWWRLRDIIEYEKAASWSLLDLVARYRDQYVDTFYRLNQQAIKTGKTEPPYGYIIPRDQDDPATLAEMIGKLQTAGVICGELTEAFTIDDQVFPAGSIYLPAAQPARAYLVDLFETHVYPEMLQYPGGPPLQPYDITTWNLPMQMGIRFKANLTQPEPGWQITGDFALPVNHPEGDGKYVIFAPQSNWSVPLAREFHQQDFQVLRITSGEFNGYFVVEAWEKNQQVAAQLARAGLPCRFVDDISRLKTVRLQPARIGIYQSYKANADEGWTRWMLDHYRIPFKVYHNSEIADGDFVDECDVLIIPSINKNSIQRGWVADNSRKNDPMPEQYTGGIEKAGVWQIEKFLSEGGRLLVFGQAIPFAVDVLQLPVEINKKVNRDNFYIPGALLKMELDCENYLAAGLPGTLPVFFADKTPLMTPKMSGSEYAIPGRFAGHDLLVSGWMRGESVLHNRAALFDIPVKKGNVILYGFSPQHRGQTYNSFRLIFNALWR